MERILGAVRVFVWVMFAVCGLVAVETRADFCQLEPFCQFPPCGQQELICYPEYETHMTSQPDWCLYEPGDQVFVKFNSTGKQIGWYVYYANDPNATRPSTAYDQTRFFVQHNPGSSHPCILVFLW